MIELSAIEAARGRIADVSVKTPLVRLDAGGEGTEIHLKLEMLQAIGSFEIRGAANAVRCAPEAVRAEGLVTASGKLGAVARLGGEVVCVSYEEWWQTIVTSRVEGTDGLFVHPVQDEHVMAGNGTIGLEILKQLPDPDAVVIPFGGGGLTVGIASAIRALRPQTRVFTAEPATGAALAAALRAGGPADVDYRPSFVDGSGSRRVLDEMWPRVSELVDGAVTVPIEAVASAVRLLAERVHVIAEGAGALALAAALAGNAGRGKIVCIVSGGNIDFGTLSEILAAPERAAFPGGEG